MVVTATPRCTRAIACALLIPLAALAFDAGMGTWASNEARGWLSFTAAIAAFVCLSAPAYALLPPTRFFRFFCALAVVGVGLSWTMGASPLLLIYGGHVLLVFTLAARRRYPEAYGPVPMAVAPLIGPRAARTKPEGESRHGR